MEADTKQAQGRWGMGRIGGRSVSDYSSRVERQVEPPCLPSSMCFGCSSPTTPQHCFFKAMNLEIVGKDIQRHALAIAEDGDKE